jgi:hypothetical protein
MLKGSSGSLQSEFQRLADSQASNLGKIYESFLKVLLVKRSEKKKGLKVEKKPKSKELGIKAEKKSSKDLGLRVENKGKSKIIERGANEVGKIPEVSPTATAQAKESLIPKLLYEYSKDTGKSRVMLSPEESQAVLELTDKSTKEGDIIKNGADLKISDSNNRTLFETDSKGVVIYSQNQRNPSVLKENGLGSAMDSLRGDLSNVISKAEARKPLSKGVEELNQSSMSLDEEVLAKTMPYAKPVQKDQDIPRAKTGKEKANLLTSFADKSMVPSSTVSKSSAAPPKELSDQEKTCLLNNPDLGLKHGSSVEMVGGGKLSVEQYEDTLIVFHSDGERPSEQIASVQNGVTKISPQFSEQVSSAIQDHITSKNLTRETFAPSPFSTTPTWMGRGSELPHHLELDSPSVKPPQTDDDLTEEENLEAEEDYEYEH